MNRRTFLAAAGAAALATTGEAMAPRELFVATDGSDTNPGTKAKPLATLEAARDRLRSHNGPKRITLRGGNYFRTTTLELDARDSQLTLRAAPGATVRLIGGAALRGGTRTDDPRIPAAARGKVLVFDLKAQGITDFGTPRRRGMGIATTPAPLELFADSEPMTVARWPNADTWATIEKAAPDGFTVAVEHERLARWQAADELWVHGYWTWDWADSYEHVVAIDPAARKLTTAAPHGVYGYTAGKRWYALNLLEELDTPGEYYVERKTGRLFFYPPRENAELLVSLLETPLVRVTDASGVVIEGLTLEAARGEGIVIQGGTRCQVAGCTLRGLGTNGITIEGGTAHHVLSCDLTTLGESGVSVSGGDRTTLTPAGHVVENCDIHHHSRLCRTYRPAIGLQGVANKALHNRLHDGPHNAILMGGNDHEIAFNTLFRVCTQTGDAGAIYMGRNLTMRGTVIHHNYFYEIGPTLHARDGFVDVMAVYLDDCYCGTTIRNNIFVKAGRAAMIGGGRDNVIENNLFVDCNPAIHVDARGTGWASFWFDGKDPFLMDGLKAVPYDRPPYATRYPHLAGILADEPAKAKYNQLKNNVVIGRGKPIDWLDGLSEKTVETTGNTFAKAPAEVALDPRTFSVKAPGFTPIPFARIGLYKDRYRKRLP